MANKRMFNKTVIDSDAFLDMPQTTQNLYFHLNMRADDDGFLDNPKKVMRTIGANQNDLEILLAKRYLLAFDNGVVVIKHWRLHNTIRKDRYKPTLYQEQIRTLIEKDSGVYTEAYNLLEQKEIDEWQPNGNQMATVGRHRLDKIRLDKNRREEKKQEKKENPVFSEPSHTAPASFEPYIPPEKNYSAIWENSRKHWNKKKNLPEYKRALGNESDMKALLNFIAPYEQDEIIAAIDNYSELLDSIECKYGTFKGFMRSGVDQFHDGANPHERYKGGKQATSEEIEEAQRLAEEIFG